jgi:hypothetical protein
MKKLLISAGSIIGIIVLLPFLGFGIYAWDLFYNDINTDEVEKAAIKYLEQKYGEHFVIVDASYTKALGDDEGVYELNVHPAEQPEINFWVNATEKYEITGDSYKEDKWRNEAKKEYIQLIKPIFPNAGHVDASGSFPEQVAEAYDIDVTYQTIFKENPKQSHEYLEIMMFASSVNKEEELKKIYQLYETIAARNLRSYRIQVEYYPENLEEELGKAEGAEQFENKYYKESLYGCRIMSSEGKGNPIAAPGDLAKYCN